jgi:hypothetical protein
VKRVITLLPKITIQAYQTIVLNATGKECAVKAHFVQHTRLKMNRNDYLGASEVGAIVAGRDEYDRTPLSIYLEKLGLKDKSESEIMQRGIDLEKTIFFKFLENVWDGENSWTYQPTDWDHPIMNPEIPWLACHPDATDEQGNILEIKLVGHELPIDGDDAVKWLKAIRPSWYYQAQAQLLITGKARVILFVWVNSPFAWHSQMTVEILPNKTDMQEIVEKTHAFYYDNLLANKIPEYAEEKPVELKTDFVETDAQLIQDIQDFAEMTVQEHNLKTSLDNLKDKLKGVYSKTTHKSILAGQILLRANMKLGASRLSKDRCIAQGLDLTGCYERGAPVYTLEVARRKEEK